MLHSRDSDSIRRVLQAQRNLLEVDHDLRRLERAAATGDSQAGHRYERGLIRSGNVLWAAKHHLHPHGMAYLKAHAAHKQASNAWSRAAQDVGSSEVPDEVDKHYDATEDDLKKKHEDYRKAVHSFREKHELPHPEAAYYRMQGDRSPREQSDHVGEDSLAGKALPSHEEAGVSREHHAHAVVSAVHHEHDEPHRMTSAENSHHAEEAVAHHYPHHRQEWDVVEHNRDNTPNYVAFKGLGPQKSHPEEKTRKTTQFRQGLPIHPD